MKPSTNDESISVTSNLTTAPLRQASRWIRPLNSQLLAGRQRRPGVGREFNFDKLLDELGATVLWETRKRLSSLAALERELEDKIRARWQEAEERIGERAACVEEELGSSRRRADAEAKELRLRSEREGRATGFREGFARGREEGHRLGCEEGRREGLKEGHQEGRAEGSRRLEQEMAGAVAALSHAALELEEKREALLAEAKRDLLTLSLEVAARLVKREVERVGDVALRNVEKAIELVFRRGAVVIQVNPADRAAIEQALASDPRWGEGFDSVEIRPAADISPGGCRLAAGAGKVDMTISTQLALIAEALGLAAGHPTLAPGASEVKAGQPKITSVTPVTPITTGATVITGAAGSEPPAEREGQEGP